MADNSDHIAAATNSSNGVGRQNCDTVATSGLSVVVAGNQSASRKSLFENPEDKPDYSHDPAMGPQVRLHII